MKIKLVEIPNKNNNPKRPSAHLIEESGFKHFYEKLHYTQKDFTEKLGINHRVFRRSLHTYYSKEEVETNRRIRCSRSARSRDPSTLKRGPRNLILSRKELEELFVTQHLSLREIARNFKTTPFVIKTNLRYHGLTRDDLIEDFSRSFKEDDLMILQSLDRLSPGILEDIKENYLDDKVEIADQLFLLYQELKVYQDWIKNRVHRLRKQLNSQGISLSDRGIVFGLSKLEVKLKGCLIELNLGFISHFKIKQSDSSVKWFYYDFYIPDKNLLIECDGSYWHGNSGVVRNDEKKTLRAKELGYTLLRFDNKIILKHIDRIKKDVLDVKRS